MRDVSPKVRLNRERSHMCRGLSSGILLSRSQSLRAYFFLFLAYSGLVYAAGRKKKNTEHERVQCLGTTEHERGPYTHDKKHTLNARGCSFEYN